MYQLIPCRDIADQRIQLNQRHKWPHPTKSNSLRSQLPIMSISMQNINDIDWFFPVIFLIKESCNLITKTRQLVITNQKWWF